MGGHGIGHAWPWVGYGGCAEPAQCTGWPACAEILPQCIGWPWVAMGGRMGERMAQGGRIPHKGPIRVLGTHKAPISTIVD